MEIRYARDVFGKGWFINTNHIVYAEKIENSDEVSQLIGNTELKKCYVLHMINGHKIILEHMI